MPTRKKIDYTLRGVPPETAARIRETAEADGTSVNATLLRLIDRGLGSTTPSVRQRNLSALVRTAPDPEHVKFTRRLLAEMDVVDESLWK